jgi:hypothetical protein
LPYRIDYSPETEDHFRTLTARRKAIILDAVDEQLMYQPMVETKNRKPMRPNPVAHGNFVLATCGYTMMWKKTLNPWFTFARLGSKSVAGFASGKR